MSIYRGHDHVYARVQQAKGFADLQRGDECQACLEAAEEGSNRFPILNAEIREAVGQVRAMHNDPDASKWFRGAVEAAEEHGLKDRAKELRQALKQPERQFP